MRNLLLTAALTIAVASTCMGHLGDRLVPVFEIPDDMIEDIDIHDESIDDWLSVIGEPTLTAAEFAPFYTGESYDPSDLDFRVWLAWHRMSNRVYAAIHAVDDIFVETDNSGSYRDGRVNLYLDGDHSGGFYDYGAASTLSEEVQLFAAFPASSQQDRPVWVLQRPRVFLDTLEGPYGPERSVRDD